MSEFPTSPQQELEQITVKIGNITREYSSGKLNRAQFYAMYRHYNEKREVITKLAERNPESDAWRNAAAQGATSFLRDRFEARPLYWVSFRQGEKRPLMYEGKMPSKAAEQVHKMLKVVWRLETWRKGLARQSIGDGMWIIMVMGEQALTMIVYFMQPSTIQTTQIRNLHDDFERANKNLLQRGLPAKRMVFPQRSLLDDTSH